ncbi:hypothetical protein OGV25_21320 [Pseudomonas sp. P1B16]|uniref:Uncharacterized protein n=1 Tax=Pseudomonas nitroreducens TaxID=46680 RepID=A0A6G6ISC0_PSENT|nr:MULTISPECIES: hypothetical protein [Pseudomonas]KYO75156.1 hypothetical protein LT18_06151 [Pseudomonas aeruginosa]NWD83663.1 hypothetical protein [Pseudomonas reactans]QIE86035.1 hypothetical protein G5B91_07035 [Pseudomonas nitroreducens]WPM25701.1 hypothetical protein OGV25_21320 [Pseudomonas sp. P1B16]
MNWTVHRRGQRLGLALLWALLLLVAAVAANVVGIHLAGGIEGWQQWLTAHTNHFLAWRLMLYAGTVWGWLWMRRRVLAREPSARQRLLRAEIAAVVAVAALEISQITGG